MTQMAPLSIMDLRNFLGIGVAGNFSGHLEDADEKNGFSSIQTGHLEAPKGIFPFYMPGAINTRLHVNPLSSTKIILPQGPANVQMEPELALLCDLKYQGNLVASVHPTHFAASNDCSIRRPGGKLSSKKNWGEASHGISDHFIPLDFFKPGGALDDYRLASYLKRDDFYYPYGVDSAVVTYSYFYAQLIDWIIDRMNHQKDEGPLEDFQQILKDTRYPRQAVILVGATRYENFGKSGYLKATDETFIFLYDRRLNSCQELLDHVKNGSFIPEHCSLLHQIVKGAK